MQSIGNFFCWLKNLISNNSATVIALSALFVSLYEAYRGRRHDRLSVRPWLCVYKKKDKDKETGLRLVNNGIGPAIINSFNVYLDNQLVSKPGSNFWKEIITKFKIDMDKVSFRTFVVPFWLPAREDLPLFALKLEVADSEEGKLFNSIIERIKIVIEYQSCYAGRVFSKGKYTSRYPKIDRDSFSDQTGGRGPIDNPPPTM